MMLPETLNAVVWIKPGAVRGEKLYLDIRGKSAWLRRYPHSLTIAIETEITIGEHGWLRCVSLWLFSFRASLNDSLMMDGDRLLLLRRYAPDLSTEEWVAGIEQQLAVADWLICHAQQVEH